MSPAHVSALGEIGRGRFFFQRFPLSDMAQAALTTVQGKTTLSLLIRISKCRVLCSDFNVDSVSFELLLKSQVSLSQVEISR